MRKPAPSSTESAPGTRRSTAPLGRNRSQLSVMDVFRDCAETKTSRHSSLVDVRSDGNEVEPLVRPHREGVGPEALRRNLGMDVAALMNTIKLEAVVDLSNHPMVRRSVVNHGFIDLTSVSRSRKAEMAVAEQIRQTLVEREPRLNPVTLAVQLGEQDGSRTERLIINIEAEIRALPFNVPVGFTVEIDIGAGKMRMRRLPGGS